jgi:hypothetical protein
MIISDYFCRILSVQSNRHFHGLRDGDDRTCRDWRPQGDRTEQFETGDASGETGAECPDFHSSLSGVGSHHGCKQRPHQTIQ